MRSLQSYGALLAALFTATTFALEILSPTPGSGVDPTKPLSILWSVDYNDPALIDIRFTNGNPDSLPTDLTLATGVASYTGVYTVPANTIQTFGTDYQILIVSDGKTLASSTGLVLGQSSNEVTTDANGQVTLVSTATNGAASASPTGGTLTNGVETATIASVGVTTLSGTLADSDSTSTTAGGTSSRASTVATSTSSRSSGGGSGQSSASATVAQSTNAASQLRFLDGELVLGAAGMLAGLVALVA